MSHNIYALGITKKNSNNKAEYIENYVNDKLFSDNVLSLIDREDFNIENNQTEAFTHNGVTYLFTKENDIIYYVVTKNGYPGRILVDIVQDMKTYFVNFKSKGKYTLENLLKRICDKFDDPVEIDKLLKVQKKSML